MENFFQSSPFEVKRKFLLVSVAFPSGVLEKRQEAWRFRLRFVFPTQPIPPLLLSNSVSFFHGVCFSSPLSLSLHFVQLLFKTETGILSFLENSQHLETLEGWFDGRLLRG